MAAAEEGQNEVSVENLVDVQNSAMVRPISVKCPARFDSRSTGIRLHRIFGLRSGEERRLERGRDEGSQQSRPKEQTPVSLRLPEDKVTMCTADDSFRHAAVCAQTRQPCEDAAQISSYSGGVLSYAVHMWCNDNERIVTTRCGMASCIDSECSHHVCAGTFRSRDCVRVRCYLCLRSVRQASNDTRPTKPLPSSTLEPTTSEIMAQLRWPRH